MMKMKIIRALALAAVVASAIPTNAKSAVLAYEQTGIGNEFGVADLATGFFTPLGSTGQSLAGLGSYGGNIYGVAYHGSSLYSINTSNGALSLVGASDVAYGVFGSTTSGLFGFGGNGKLYSINPTTGAAIELGPTGLSFGGTVMGMSTGSSTLYLTQNNSLYSLNTTNGAATLLGTMNLSESGFGALVQLQEFSTAEHTPHKTLLTSTQLTRKAKPARL
jgi:hypothetical protein